MIKVAVAIGDDCYGVSVPRRLSAFNFGEFVPNAINTLPHATVFIHNSRSYNGPEANTPYLDDNDELFLSSSSRVVCCIMFPFCYKMHNCLFPQVVFDPKFVICAANMSRAIYTKTGLRVNVEKDIIEAGDLVIVRRTN